MTAAFSYDEFITRNIGFVSEAEQARLRAARVFVAGVGGMGGAALACLVRSGIGGHRSIEHCRRVGSLWHCQ
jgi:tRNA A37 threonylcarbamoyladenosine dehydratase